MLNKFKRFSEMYIVSIIIASKDRARKRLISKFYKTTENETIGRRNSKIGFQGLRENPNVFLGKTQISGLGLKVKGD